MTDTVQIALITGIVTSIPAVGALVISILNGRKAVVTDKKADALIEKTQVIHTLADGNLSKVTAALAIADSKIEGLQTLVASMVESRKDVAAALVAPVPDFGTSKR